MSGMKGDALKAIEDGLKLLNIFDSLKRGSIPKFADGGKVAEVAEDIQRMVNQNTQGELRNTLSDWLKKHNELNMRIQQQMKKEPVIKMAQGGLLTQLYPRYGDLYNPDPLLKFANGGMVSSFIDPESYGGKRDPFLMYADGGLVSIPTVSRDDRVPIWDRVKMTDAEARQLIRKQNEQSERNRRMGIFD